MNQSTIEWFLTPEHPKKRNSLPAMSGFSPLAEINNRLPRAKQRLASGLVDRVRHILLNTW